MTDLIAQAAHLGPLQREPGQTGQLLHHAERSCGMAQSRKLPGFRLLFENIGDPFPLRCIFEQVARGIGEALVRARIGEREHGARAPVDEKDALSAPGDEHVRRQARACDGHAQLPAEPRHQRMHEVLQGRVAVQFVLLDPARRSVPSGQTFWTACFHVTVPLRPQSLTGMSLKTFFKQISSGWMKSLIFDAWHPTRSGSRLPTTVAPWLAAMARTRSSIETRLFP